MSPAAARAAGRASARTRTTRSTAATAAVAAPAPAPAAPRTRTRTKPAPPRTRERATRPVADVPEITGTAAERTRERLRSQAHGQRRLSFGVLCIGVTGFLLAGVVAVNVLVLRQNVQLDGSTRERTRLRAENANLASQVSAAVSASRIEGLAERALGLQPAAPEATTYLDMGSRP
jgi:cell division protein FtsL